jgi:hypothetical protein
LCISCWHNILSNCCNHNYVYMVSV